VNLFVQHAVRVDEVASFLARNARADVVVDQVRHPEDGHQSVAGGEIDPGLPLIGRDGRLDVAKGKHFDVAHLCCPSR